MQGVKVSSGKGVMVNPEQVVLVIGAGGTVADCMKRSALKRPPLDRGFFATAMRLHAQLLRPVTEYLNKYYGIDLAEDRWDSLEYVMAMLYTDTFGGDLEAQAFRAFRVLITVFLRRLANTTNDLPMTRGCRLYRLIAGYLNRGVLPENLTIITFNQDIQVEKALDAISRRSKWRNRPVFVFPYCYRIEARGGVTGPSSEKPQFDVSAAKEGGVTLLKLHGSLNWYSAHTTSNPVRSALFNDKRRIGITRRQAIDTGMMLKSGMHTFPIVIPPVVHKSGILHRELRPVWALAEERLKLADRIVIFGYSCPATDWESANLLGRALTANAQHKQVSVIDPNAGVLLRYVQLADLPALNYYKSVDAYLDSR